MKALIIQNKNWLKSFPTKKSFGLLQKAHSTGFKNDKHEWTNRKMIFEIITKGDKTALHFTHEGLFLKRSAMQSVNRVGVWLLKIGSSTLSLKTNHTFKLQQ